MKFTAGLAGTVLACAGCVPFPVYDSPALQGRVEDHGSNAPIPGAQINLAPVYQPALVSNTTTDAAGRFQVKEIKHRAWALPLPFDSIYPNATVNISAMGYKPLQTTSNALMMTGRNEPDVIIYLDRE